MWSVPIDIYCNKFKTICVKCCDVGLIPVCGSQGPMTVVVQEFDGNFSHTIQVEDLSTTHELPCHSKIRK